MKLITEKLCVDRGFRRIVQDVSFELAEGESLIVGGENGAGKSTLLRAIAGLLELSSGKLNLKGESQEAPVREYCHYLGHKNGMKDALSVRENLEFWQTHCAAPDVSIKDALEIVGMGHTLDLPFGYLSTGMKRRVSIAKLLVSERPVWIVDEPTAGLDAQSVKMFAGLSNDFCKDGGILIAATHLALGIKKSKTLNLEKLITVYEGDELYDAATDGPAT